MLYVRYQVLIVTLRIQKKEIIYYILKSIPVISPVFFIVGELVVILGVEEWRKNELLLDVKIKIDHDLK